MAAGFEELSEQEQEEVLRAGKGALKRGTRVLIAYLRAAPKVCKAIGKEDFASWLALARRISKLSVSCCEGFFESSLPIIKKGGLALLGYWTDTGIALSEHSKWVSIAYFRHTGKVIVSTGPERFKGIAARGTELTDINTKVSEAYFEHLIHFHTLLTPQNFNLFCNIAQSLSKEHWLISIEFISLAGKTLRSIPEKRRAEMLQAMYSLLDLGEGPSMALYRNAGAIIGHADEQSFAALMRFATDLARHDRKSSMHLLNSIAQYMDKLELSEAEQWKNKALDSLQDNREALRTFIQTSLILGKNTGDTDRKSRSAIIERGIMLAEIEPKCLENYFSNAALAYKLFTADIYEEWVGTGEGIAMQDPGLAAAYYERSLLAMRDISPQHHEQIFRTANVLLGKDATLTSLFFGNLGSFIRQAKIENATRWAEIGIRLHEMDRRLAGDYFTHSVQLLGKLDVDELEQWALKGLELSKNKPSKSKGSSGGPPGESSGGSAGEAYFSLVSKTSTDLAEELSGSLELKKVTNVLRYYALGLCGTNFVIRSMTSLPLLEDTHGVNPIIAGNTIYLAPKMRLYQSIEDNFRIYKLSVMHEVGHVRFSSLDIEPVKAGTLVDRISREYNAADHQRNTDPHDPEIDIDMDIADILSLFPNQILAATIFGILEDARVEYMIMEHYRGVRYDLEEIRHRMLLSRPGPSAGLEEFMEALLWASTGHKVQFDTDELTRKVLEDVRKILEENIFIKDSTTTSCLEGTFEIYSKMEEHFGPLGQIEYQMLRNIAYRGMDIGASGSKDPVMTRPSEDIIRNFMPETEADLTAQEERPKEQATNKPTQALNKNWSLLGTYRYDEWDSSINDYRTEWSTINEIEPSGGSTSYYNKAMERYSNEIALLKHTFSMMRPEAFHRLKEQKDGTEIDIDAFTESLIAKRCGINPDERLYIRWDKHERDVATLFLIDVSASTRKILGNDGRSILEVEKDALIIMSQALESIGDKYAIYAFSGKGRENIEYFLIKGFDEELSDEVACRMSLLQPASNTRLGPAIRHSVSKLEQAQANTKMLVLLSDGEPYDRSKGEGTYQGDLAQEDTRVAINEAKNRGIHFFCITVDKNPGDYLDKIFSDVGYTIIDDALMLPETLPLLYKRLTM
ncbi:MAG: VWA domain-containing protein [Methanolobus sp.]|nr:VWA domain-containing protein [Methanolobus sp.]